MNAPQAQPDNTRALDYTRGYVDGFANGLHHAQRCQDADAVVVAILKAKMDAAIEALHGVEWLERRHGEVSALCADLDEMIEAAVDIAKARLKART